MPEGRNVSLPEGPSQCREEAKTRVISYANGKAKSKAIDVLVRAARRARLNYDGFLYVCQQARRKLQLTRPQPEHKLPHLLPDAALKRFFQIIQECGDLQHEILLKLLFYTAVRVRELARMRVEDVDLEHCRIFIQQGKGSKTATFCFPPASGSS